MVDPSRVEVTKSISAVVTKITLKASQVDQTEIWIKIAKLETKFMGFAIAIKCMSRCIPMSLGIHGSSYNSYIEGKQFILNLCVNVETMESWIKSKNSAMDPETFYISKGKPD